MKTLVAYFSASGVTANVAKLLAEAAGADLFEIKPAVPYTNADLNWMDKTQAELQTADGPSQKYSLFRTGAGNRELADWS